MQGAVLLLAGAIAATPPTDPWPISVLEDLVTGPLAGRPLVVYLDETLGFSTSQLIRSAFQGVPLVLADLRIQGKEWCERQTQEVLGAGWLVHLVLLGSNATVFFEDLATVECNWQPLYLLLVNTRGGSPDALMEEAFSRVEHLALLSVQDRASNSSLSTFIYSFFPFSHQAPVRLTGIWSTSTSLQHLFVDRFPSFEGYQFQIASWVDDYPYLYLTSGETDDLRQVRELQTGEASGLQVEVLDTLGYTLNFTYTMMTRPEDWLWGELQDGAWTGMLGKVHSGEKNFTVNFFGYNLERTRAFDASSPYWMEGYGLTILAPPPLPKWRAAYYPFNVFVWGCCVAAFLLVVIGWTLQGGSSGGDGKGWLYLLRPLLNQSLPTLPSSQGLRISIATWCLAAFILTTAYTANLFAFLSVPAFPPRIRTVEELAESSLRVTMCDYGEFVPEALNVSGNQYYRALGTKLDLHEEYNNTLPLLINGSHAFLESYSYSRILLKLSDYDVSATYMLKEQLYPAHLCWYYKKHSPWKHRLDRGLEKTNQLLGRGWQSEDGGTRQDSPLSLQHLQAPFLILLLVLLVSVLVLLVEIILHKLKEGSGCVTSQTLSYNLWKLQHCITREIR
ncbi:uncharacterized protein LOC135091270 isoform X2 [Scylla paramamosain]|uniref:uncharacterized protein LOC135091270 isoform X2 n=1 Tax=Scylla paramamosain TaxID=85552 RepID=UPI003082C966